MLFKLLLEFIVKRIHFGLVCGFVLACFALNMVMPVAVVAQDSDAQIAPASDEGELAMKGFKVPDGMTVAQFAAEPMLANPVAFCIDAKGRLYICETFRQGKGVEDNRGHMNWLEDDLALESVDERMEMFKKYLGDTVATYGQEEDRIRLIEDTDGDGKADKATVFADGFNGILDGTGAGVLAIDGDVYYTCIPKLWKLRDTDGDGKADKKEAHSEGYGIRIAFRGHDMHGLVIGPDGRLYWSIGDRGYNVMTAEGSHLFRPDTGAVFRCELDGSDLEVFASGLRNPQELAFDNYGNLFTGDNNSDSGDKARWVNVVEGTDTGWRMYYQYLSDRGPWNRERIWHPYHEDEETTAKQPAYIHPPIINLGDGPSGLVHYPGVGLSDRYKDHFLMADFRGGSANSGIRSFAVKPKGATFELVDSHWLIEAVLATDVDFGYDGRIYVTDWVDGWYGPGKGRVYTFTDEKHQYPPAVEHSDVLMKQGFDRRKKIELASLLSHPDRRIRQTAQFELAKRKEVQLLTAIASSRSNQLSRLHAIWGLGQLLRAGNAEASTVSGLLNADDAEVRAQAIRVLCDAGASENLPAIIDRIQKGTPREQAFAMLGLGRLIHGQSTDEKIVPQIIDVLRKNNDGDPVLRHAGVMGLVHSSNGSELAEFVKDDSAAVRVAVVVAMRRMNSSLISNFLNDKESRVVDEAARAIHDLPIETALPALAALSDHESMSDALIRRVLNANYRLGGSAQAAVVARIAANTKLPIHIREEAAFDLLHWDAVPVLDRVLNKYRPVQERKLEEANSAVHRHLPTILDGGGSMKTTGLKLAAKYLVTEATGTLLESYENHENDAQMRVEAIRALAKMKVDGVEQMLIDANKDKQPGVRSAALSELAALSPDKALPSLKSAMENGTRLEKQSAVAVLGSLKSDAADAMLLGAMDQFIAGTLPKEIQLDVLNVAMERKSDAFTSRLKTIEASRDESDLMSMFRECLEGGNVERGKEVFFGNAAASCRRCHVVNGEGSAVGPDLSGVSKENPREYLLESIVNPNAKIAKGFEPVVFAMEDGRILSGTVRSENDESYTLMKSTGEQIVVKKDQIDDQAKGKSGMPDDLRKQLSKSDIRDLVEYLSTLKTPVKKEGH